MKRQYGFACVLVLSLAVGVSNAAMPELIEFNGTLAWSGTNAPVAGVYPFTVRLYDQLTEGTLLWEEQANVEVSASGNYGLQLGAGVRGSTTNSLSDALNLAGSAAFLELEVSINGQTRLFSPRQPLASAPFALMAGNAHRATKGLTVDGQLFVEGDTQADRVTAGTVECSEVVVTKQITLLPGPLYCSTLVAPTTNEPIVFSTGVRNAQDMRVAGGLKGFSIRKPGLKLSNPSMRAYQADTDCWLYMVPDNSAIQVYVGYDLYTIYPKELYPIPIPKGAEFRIVGGQELNTDPNSTKVMADGSYPKSFYLSLGVAP